MIAIRGWVSWVLVLSAAIASAAQPPPDAAPAEAAKPAEDADKTLREQTIYVPYSKLQKIFEKQGRGVFLPYEEFQKLWDQARAAMAREPDEKPPVEALITEINSEATVGDEVVNVTAKLNIEVLAEGWHEIPLRLGDAAILSAKQGDQPARVTVKAGSGYVLLVHKTKPDPEQLEVSLQYSKAFTKSPGQNVVSFEAPQAPVNQWRIRVPQAGVKVNVQPLVAATQVPPPAAEGAPAETVVMAFVGAAPTVQIDWTPKAEGAAGLEALATVQSEQQVTIDEGVIRTRIQLTYAISRAEMSQLVIEAPADHKVLNVFDPNIREWKVEQAENVQKITAQLYQAARELQRVLVEMEKFSADMEQAPLTVPVVKASGVGRQQGVLVVRVAPTLRAEAASRLGLLQVDTNELPSHLAGSPWDFSYRFPSLPFELSLRIEKVQPLIRTHELVEAYLEPERLTVDLLALFDIERAGVFQLELDIPAGFEVRSVRGHAAAGAEAAAIDTHHVSKQENAQRLIVNLARKALGKVGLFIELQRNLEDPNLLTPTGKASDIPLPLPRVAPAGIERSTGRLLIYAPTSLRVNPTKQDGVQTISFAEALQDAASTRDNRFPTTREILAYAYSQGPVDLSLAVERQKPFIQARQLLLARVEAGLIKYEATFFFEIQYSGVKSLRLDVPAGLAAEIRNQTPNVVREAPLDPQPADVAEGYVAWGLTGETELFGQLTAKFAWEKKMGELQVGKPVEESPPHLQPKNANQAWGQIVIAKAETLDVRPAGEPTGLRPIDPQHDLMPGVTVEDAARAFEFYGDWSLKLTITRYELVEIKRTSIERAVVRMEVTRSDLISVQALYRMRSAQQRLPIVLAKEAKFDTDPLRINGRSVALERGDKEEYFVPLAGRNVGEEFVLEVRYTVPGDHRRLDLPQFPGDPAVQKVCLCAYVPEELTVLGSRGPWTDEMSWHWYEMRNGWPRPIQSDVELVGWVIEGLNLPTNPAADFATDGRLYTFSTLEPPPPPDGSLRLVVLRRTTLHVIVFVVVMLGGLLAIRRSLPAKLALAVLLLVVLLILSVFLPAFTRQIMDGALYIAVAVVLAIWFLWHVAWAVVALSAAQKTRREQKAESGEPKAESGEPRAESQTPKAEGEEVKAPEKEGESPFASPSQPEASKPPEAGSDASPSDASSKPQEGGPSHA